MNRIKKLFTLLTVGLCVFFSACKNDVALTENTEKKLAKITPVLKTEAERTAFLDYGTLTAADFGNFYLYAYLNETYLKSNSSSYNWGSYSTFEALQKEILELPEGTWYFKLIATSTESSYRFEDVVLKTVTAEDSVNLIEFVLKPSSEAISFTGYVDLKFNFPVGTKPVLKSVTGERRYYNNDSINDTYDWYEKNSFSDLNNYVSDVSEDGVPYISFTVSAYKNNVKDNHYIYVSFYNLNEDDEVTGIFEYTTSTCMQYSSQHVKEEYDVLEFMPVHQITYHMTDASEITEEDDEIYIGYYASAFGSALYNTYSYNWYSDKACTRKVDAINIGDSGNKELYWTADKNYQTLTFKDSNGRKVCSYSVPKGEYYRLYKDYVYIDGVGQKTEIVDDTKYIKNYYSDAEMTHSISTGNYYYVYEDVTVYVDYAAACLLSIYEVNGLPNAEPLMTYKITNGSFKLTPNYIYDGNSTSYYQNAWIKKFYSDSRGTKELATGYNYPIKANTNIYVELDVPHTLTLVDVITKETIDTVTIRLDGLKFYGNYVYSGDNEGHCAESYLGSLNIAKYYYDALGQNVVPQDEWIFGFDEDVTIYAHKANYPILIGTKDTDNPWTSDTITVDGNEVQTGYYSYTAEASGTYYYYLYDRREVDSNNPDSYFYVFVNNVFINSYDDPYGVRYSVTLSAGDVITIKHARYGSASSNNNMDPIPNYATDVFDSDDIRIEGSTPVLPPIPTE